MRSQRAKHAALCTMLAAVCATCLAQPAKPQPPKAVSRLEAEELEKLRKLDKAGKHKEILARTIAKDLSEKSFNFQREVLLLQADAFRRTGRPYSARGPLMRLLDYARKRPVFRRKEEVSEVLFLVGLYKQVKYEKYVSPRAKAAPTTRPADRGFSISDDAGWKRAKDDYARYSLGRLDGRLRMLENSTDPRKMKSQMMDMLDCVDIVRPHVPGLANSKTVYLVTGLVSAFDKTVARKTCLQRAQRLQNGTLWPKRTIMRLGDRIRIAERICRQVRQLCIVNYGLGNQLTDYARKHGLTEDLDDSLATLSERRQALQSAYVQVETFVDNKHRVRRLGTPPSDPLKKIPTGKW